MEQTTGFFQRVGKKIMGNGEEKVETSALAKDDTGITDLEILLENVVRAMVDHPESVEVSTMRGEQTTVIQLRAHKNDLGKVIGKQGRTARALRTIVENVASKNRFRAVLEIEE